MGPLRRRAVLLVAGLIAVAPTRAAGRGAGGDFRVRLADPRLTIAVLRALDGASAQLARPDCAAVLEDFADGHGRTLRARLDELGLPPPTYLRAIDFVAGDERPRCSEPAVLAVTRAGASVVFVCRYFRQAAAADPQLAETAVIHEALHTLGLAEDPPTSAEINARIRTRCRPDPTGAARGR